MDFFANSSTVPGIAEDHCHSSAQGISTDREGFAPGHTWKTILQIPKLIFKSGSENLSTIINR